MIFWRIVAIIAGIIITYAALRSAVRTFVLSRSAPDPITGAVFRTIRAIFNIRLFKVTSYHIRERTMAYYAPVGLLALLIVWLALVLIGFMLLYWGGGIGSWDEAFIISGSSLLTLGFARGDTILHTVFSFIEASLGLILVALLIAYLPTMYNAFSRRESAVTMLETRAGTPPSAVELLLRYHRNHGLHRLHEVWKEWEVWFAEIEESHTALAPLVFFRSPKPDHSWVTSAGAMLDSASLTLSVIDLPWDAQAALCIRAGYLALREIADFFRVQYPKDPKFPDDPISITREEFDEVYDQFARAEFPLRSDRDKAWQDFGGWRVNYDIPLLALCKLTMAPEAPWSSDRIPDKVQNIKPYRWRN